MSDDFLDWWYADAGDRRVRRRLEGQIDQAYASQAREASAIRSQMSQLQGTLEQRIDRLAKAFDAFVELSDVRAELALFEPETSVRNGAQRLLRGLLRTPDAPPSLPADLPECRGYWLRPAVASLAAAISGDEPGAASALTEATELDELRAAVFLAAGLALASQAARAFPLLRPALQQPGEQATYAQRALWTACAQGAYGDQGEGLIAEWLAGYVQGLSADVISAERSRWTADAGRVPRLASREEGPPGELPAYLAKNPALVNPRHAAGQLVALKAWVREAMTGEPAYPDGAARHDEAGGAARDSAAGGAAAEPSQVPVGKDSPLTALAAVAAALAEEGSQDEIALRKRARELREVIDSRRTATRPSWDAPAARVADLLRKDAFGADLRSRRLALSTSADWLSGAAAELARAASAPPPQEFQVRIDWHEVTLHASGQASLSAANAEIEQGNTPQGVTDMLFHRKRLEEETARKQDELAREASQAAAALARRVAALREAATQAQADHAAISALLAR
jgi:hypothetical protein